MSGLTKTKTRRAMRQVRHARVRRKVRGTAARPRLCVYRSLKHIYAQIIDDEAGRTLVACSSLSPSLREAGVNGAVVMGARQVGAKLAELALAAGIKEVVFDRGGFRYHGRVKALAEGAREAGLKL